MISKKKDISEKIWFWILVDIIGCFIFIAIIHFVFPVNIIDGIPTNVGAGEVLGFIGGFSAFVGTMYLGTVAIKQNKRLHKLERERFKANYFSKMHPEVFEINKVDTINNQSIHISKGDDLFDNIYEIIIAFVPKTEIQPDYWSIYNIKIEDGKNKVNSKKT